MKNSNPNSNSVNIFLTLLTIAGMYGTAIYAFKTHQNLNLLDLSKHSLAENISNLNEFKSRDIKDINDFDKDSNGQVIIPNSYMESRSIIETHITQSQTNLKDSILKTLGSLTIAIFAGSSLILKNKAS
jgi:formyltetrahydrofolate synthetase